MFPQRHNNPSVAKGSQQQYRNTGGHADCGASPPRTSGVIKSELHQIRVATTTSTTYVRLGNTTSNKYIKLPFCEFSIFERVQETHRKRTLDKEILRNYLMITRAVLSILSIID